MRRTLLLLTVALSACVASTAPLERVVAKRAVVYQVAGATTPVDADGWAHGVPHTYFFLDNTKGESCEVPEVQYRAARIGRPFACKWRKP